MAWLLAPGEFLMEARLAAMRGRLIEWLLESACPLWSHRGVDPRNGGFVEALGQDATPVAGARRVRVQPRQVFSFAQAAQLGWQGDCAALVRGGIDYLTTRYQRDDGLFRTLVGTEGEVIDSRALLYDQAFVLLGLAAAVLALHARPEFECRARELRDRIEAHWRLPGGGFLSGDVDPAASPREANPHMHLLEACLAWREIGTDPGWALWVEELADIALQRFINPATGAIAESFTPGWTPAPGLRGRLIEPGHQFEWGWLLLRSRMPGARAAALRLIAVGERAGVHSGVAVNGILDDYSVHDPNARLWPQAERLKAALLAGKETSDPAYVSIAVQAAASLFPYLQTPICGLWFDERRPGGGMADTPAPASSLYHLVGAIAAFD
jgi:mannose/cellobiose epimerase-like protein (N-acyl-D-glucosamine 2-epimerase family)